MIAVKTVHLHPKGWFSGPGAYVIVDGQFGSTGKGALAALMATIGPGLITHVTTNAGPNSGHSGFVPEELGGAKIVTRQLPVAAVVIKQAFGPSGIRVPVAYLNGGAIIDPEVLTQEINDFKFSYRNLQIHPCAAVIEDIDKQAETTAGTAKIASTGKGVGAAMARKLMREGNVVGEMRAVRDLQMFAKIGSHDWDWNHDVVLVETAQGFSLGINSPEFYPHTTSRECTVQQALADARIPVRKLRKVAMSVRTYPIRVGNTEFGNSGPCYPDQRETSWAELGVEPELTTVTHRVRRVFTWSRHQFMEAVKVNDPDLLFVTFIDYLPPERRVPFLQALYSDYYRAAQRQPDMILCSDGPRPEDVKIFDWMEGKIT